MHPRTVVALAAFAAAAGSAEAADRLSALQTAAACAPVPAAALPANPVRIVAAQDLAARELYGPGTRVVIAGGTRRGLQAGQQHYIRREPGAYAGTRGPRGASTAGWLRILVANDATAIGLVEFACDGILAGDLLQPFEVPALPAGVERTDATGEPDFSRSHRVLFGDRERTLTAPGDFLIVELRRGDGAAPGARLAIYRDPGESGLPLAQIGEAVMVAVHPRMAVARVTSARDAVQSGDVAVPRR